MKRDIARETAAQLTQAFSEKSFLRVLGIRQTEVRRLLRQVDWNTALRTLLPLKERLSCAAVLEVCRPMLDAMAPEPDTGWLLFAYQTVCGRMFARTDADHTEAQRDAVICFLQVLQVLLDAERRQLPFDPLMDFDFCSEEELTGSMVEAEYRQFMARFRQEYIYEMLRLGREVTPFRTLDHIAGVHYVSMTVARSFAARGGLVDLALISGAAAGHDIGKFGCRPGERVPYLHYHYTSQWFTQRGLDAIGHIAANHSVWDLEIENLSAESLILVYADFRVKQERDENGGEIAKIYSLTDAFDVILSKLDNVDAAKTRRYRFVYAKLLDFEKYLQFLGTDVALDGECTPAPHTDPALMNPLQLVEALRRSAVEHNIRLMHRLSHDQLFASVLEAAHSEKEWGRLRAYISVFEEYFTYLSSSQKMQTLEFLYEQLLNPDGDIRRQAATLIGRILARFHSGYKKELPADADLDPELDLPFRLWADYLQKLIRPDRRLTTVQISKIRYTAKLVVDNVLRECDKADAPRFLEELLRHYEHPDAADDAAFALMDTVVNLPIQHCTPETCRLLINFAAHWLAIGDLPQKAAALYLFSHLLKSSGVGLELRSRMAGAVHAADVENSTPLLFLQMRLFRELALDATALAKRLADPAAVSTVFLDNLKTATPWILKALGVEYLLHQVGTGGDQNVLHIATHFSNLIKVSEHVVVRRMAGKSLLKLAPSMTPDRRNEIAVELSKALETGQSDLSKYIPEYLGRFALWLTPRELDEVIDQMESLLSSSSSNVVSGALDAVGSMLESYAEYAARFGEDTNVLEQRRRRLAGLLMKGLAAPRGPVQQSALRIVGEGLFASPILSYQDKTALFTLCAKKIMCLLRSSREQDLTFFYTASALSHLYRFIVLHDIEDGPFHFTIPEKAAFFPGTFDPFSLSHKGIVQAIRDLGFEVYLAIDEFSWSKKAQPSLIRRQLVSMSVADEYDVYVFPHDIPVNLANPDDLNVLRDIFAERELYLCVGSDVVANASSYKAEPSPGSVHSLNHIVFRRASINAADASVDLSCIQGNVLQLQLATHLEDISSTRIRENIDLGRDISNLIDPTVQDYIYRNSLYLREPQYKRLLRTGDLDFSCLTPDDTAARQEAAAAIAAATGRAFRLDPRDTMVVLKDIDGPVFTQGVLTMRTVTSTGLYDALGDADAADYIRDHSAGRICLITGLHTVSATANTTAASNIDISQMLLTEALFRALGDDCSYAVFAPGEAQSEKTTALMLRSGFLHTPDSVPGHPLMLTDMRSPVALIQNLATTLKAPFSSDPLVLEAVRRAHTRFQQSVAALYPGTTVLSLNAELIYHRLVRRIVEINGVPAEPTYPRVLGKKMCAPFGKILRGNAIPNTVTKTIHTDKVFTPDLLSSTILEFPGYAPLESQIRTILSFRREVILVDDLLHSGARVQVLEPLLRKYNVPVDRVLVGLMSGRGKDLMEERGIKADCVYFIPNLRCWFVESTMYPFIGGDTVADAVPSVPGLTPAINLIMPYAYPKFFRECGQSAVSRFSRTCIENSRDILLALETSYRSRYARNLTLSRLSEAVILPLSPDKGACLRYDPNLAASACLEEDLRLLQRMRDSLE
ncbi:MAG: cytidyltransferase-related domain protein [Ruminococcaceae bacterium]|nr:cytidyltransferase-related domain protein [Oscillospiraceae bacterium]